MHLHAMSGNNGLFEFEVKDIGRFKAKRELTLLDEISLETELDDIMEGKLHDLSAKAEVLSGQDDEVSQKTAEKIISRINFCKAILVLEKSIVEKPAGVGQIRDLTEEDLFYTIWDAFNLKKKVYESRIAQRRARIYDYLSDLNRMETDAEAKKRVQAFEFNENVKNNKDLLYWFRKKYNLPISDPRAVDITPSSALQEYLEDMLERRAGESGLADSEANPDFQSWATRLKEDPGYFEQWRREMEDKFIKKKS